MCKKLSKLMFVSFAKLGKNSRNAAAHSALSINLPYLVVRRQVVTIYGNNFLKNARVDRKFVYIPPFSEYYSFARLDCLPAVTCPAQERR